MRACLLVLLVASAFAQADDYPFRIEQIKSDQSVRFVAINSSPAVVSLSFRLDGSNFKTDRDLPLTLVVEPDSVLDIVSISQARRWEPIRFHYKYSFQPGDAFAPPDVHARYCLPFAKGTPLHIVQEPGGRLTTHNDEHARYAIDFDVPEGTLVAAAREGTVIDVKDTYTEGRPDPTLTGKANYVAIIHSDHSIAYYRHLAPHRVLVRPGQKVRVGNVIARSGSTGYTYGPHLHFDVQRAVVTDMNEVVHVSIPVNFYQCSRGEKIAIREGARIRAE